MKKGSIFKDGLPLQAVLCVDPPSRQLYGKTHFSTNVLWHCLTQHQKYIYPPLPAELFICQYCSEMRCGVEISPLVMSTLTVGLKKEYFGGKKHFSLSYGIHFLPPENYAALQHKETPADVVWCDVNINGIYLRRSVGRSPEPRVEASSPSYKDRFRPVDILKLLLMLCHWCMSGCVNGYLLSWAVGTLSMNVLVCVRAWTCEF